MSSACTCHIDPKYCWWCLYHVEKIENAQLCEALEKIKKKVSQQLEGIDAEEEMQKVRDLSELMTIVVEALEESE